MAVGARVQAWLSLAVARNSLYGYLVGPSLPEIERAVVAAIDEFVAQQTWVTSSPWSVHERESADDDETDGWRLGFHYQLPDPHDERPGWFADVERLLELSRKLLRTFQHDVLIGIADDRTGCGEDILAVDSDEPDLDYLRRFLRGPSSR